MYGDELYRVRFGLVDQLLVIYNLDVLSSAEPRPNSGNNTAGTKKEGYNRNDCMEKATERSLGRVHTRAGMYSTPS